MKLSIIVTFHKYIQYLEDCFASLVDSELENFETILVLDHVEEETESLIAAYKESLHLKVLRLEGEERGVSAARNAGLSKALGEYIYFLDSDDYVYEDCIQQLIARADETKADAVYGKKRYTWFKRNVYLGVAEDKRRQEDEDEKKTDASYFDGTMAEAETLDVDEHERAIHKLVWSRRGLRNISVLNILIRKSFLDENQIRFDSRFQLYPDMPFVVMLLKYGNAFSYCQEAFYVKRKHNDPITMPALSQLKIPTRMEEQMETFAYCREIAGEEGELRKRLDRKLVNYYSRYFVTKLRRSKKDKWRTTRFELIANLLNGTHPEVLRELTGYKKRVVAAGLAHDGEKALKISNRHLAGKKFKKILKNKNELYKYLYKNKYSKEPIEETWVMFETFFGKNYSDSPKYIYEYLAQHNTKGYKFIWVLNNDTKPPYGATVVRRFSREYAYYLAKSKYFVFNVRQPLWFVKREGQVFLETWHGTPLKKLVFDQDEVTAASPLYKAQFFRQKKEWDYLIAANPFSTETFRRCFKFDNEMLEVGYPRNDLMYHPDREKITLELKKKMGIPLDKKTILYAPTWRDDEFYGAGQYKFTLKLDLMKLKEALSDEYVIILRTHHYIADNLDVTGVEDFAINLSKYDDITEIYLVSDICITDYSSVFFDYANLKRPILFYTYDIEKYRDILRGFYIDINKEVPGPLLYTTEEVVDAIKRIDQISAQYEERYKEFYDRFCSVDDGNASKRAVERVFYPEKTEK
ncbi:MAG: bifunctional glycosyltransferase family 2 protein/CDP-glycerol:glycerophosphate glycerophosphotransferase [Lachnospiraceae bacterium]|nr:bifunctional glycosyltransferase family 2 protein/CDP-glycerol:glycerophosphate glycerophosphotransferase [Lachnospiraceae bacterium]